MRHAVSLNLDNNSCGMVLAQSLLYDIFKSVTVRAISLNLDDNGCGMVLEQSLISKRRYPFLKSSYFFHK